MKKKSKKKVALKRRNPLAQLLAERGQVGQAFIDRKKQASKNACRKDVEYER